MFFKRNRVFKKAKGDVEIHGIECLQTTRLSITDKKQS